MQYWTKGSYVVPDPRLTSPGIVIKRHRIIDFVSLYVVDTLTSNPAFTAGAPECVAHQSIARHKSLDVRNAHITEVDVPDVTSWVRHVRNC